MTVTYAARPFFVKAIQISAHIHHVDDLPPGGVDHALELIDEIANIRGPDFLKKHAAHFATRATRALLH